MFPSNLRRIANPCRWVAKEKVWSGERDRRVSTAEEGAIRTVLAENGGHTEEMVLFEMALESAMRLREMSL